ncbi:MAG: hypothetical protein JSR96_06815 [Proteobacteria bacterium]|nr:hypothetical protein [Pseudomonadota bacterium]
MSASSSSRKEVTGTRQLQDEVNSVAAAEDENLLLKAQVQALRDKISILESTLLQRAEEIEQTRAELRAREPVQDTALLEAKLEDANGWVFRLAGERRVAEESLRKAALENAKLVRENGVHAAERERLADAVQVMKRELEGLHDDIVNERALREQAYVALAHEQSAMGELRGVVAKLRSDNAAAATRIAQGDASLAGLQAEVVQHGQRYRGQADLIGWLRVVAMEMQRSRRWYLLSRQQQDRRLAQNLADAGLFDAHSYLQRYPDVAQSGLDPLDHYIRHGVEEGRQR